jgi:Lon protease-like protein
MDELLLPLFPLKVVLFPRMNLPLHIFEERYKRMIAHCMEHQTEFGVVMTQDDPASGEAAVASTGCTAAVAQLVKMHDDGRMDIIVRGSRRFEVLNLNQEEPCLRGEVDFFDDEPGGGVAASDPRRAEAVQLCDEVLRMIPSKDLIAGAKVPSPSSKQLAYEIIAQVPVSLSFRQALLEIRTESERLNAVIEHLKELKGFLARLTAARVKAGSNGQGGIDGGNHGGNGSH